MGGGDCCSRCGGCGITGSDRTGPGGGCDTDDCCFGGGGDVGGDCCFGCCCGRLLALD